MFNKLRNEFLILNLSIISFTMVMAFLTIYIIMYKNINNEINMEIRNASDMKRVHSIAERFDMPVPEWASSFDADTGSEGNGVPSGTTGYIDNVGIYEPENTELPDISGQPDEFGRGGPGYRDNNPDMKEEYQKNDGNRERPDMTMTFTVVTDSLGSYIETFSTYYIDDDAYYVYMKDIVLNKGSQTGKFKDDSYYWAYKKDISPIDGKIRITFLDITSSQKILSNLIYTFLAAAAVMLGILYFISRYFANRSIRPIKEAFEKQAQFISDASHELKTPLAVIDTNADVLLSNSEETVESQRKWLMNIKNEIGRMSKLTNELLYLTQVDYQSEQRFYSEFDLSSALEECLLPMEAVIFEKDLNLNMDIEENIKLYGNAEQIKRVAVIFMDNAVKYSGEKGRIEFVLKRKNSGIVMEVSNSGADINETDLKRVFDRFYRADKSRTREKGGYGLGLAIAKEIIKNHKGSIKAKSQNGITTFSVELREVKNS